MLFADPDLATGFAQARAAARSQKRPLRLRLTIAADLPELHALRWETLCDPHDGLALALSEQVIFTRTLHSADWQPVTLRAKGDLRALVVIAAPTGLDRFNLAPIDADVEQGAALAGLSYMPTTVLTGPRQTTLAAIISRLRDGYDILYLVAHGVLRNGEPLIFPETPIATNG